MNILRLMFADTVFGPRTLCLCDEGGNPLPNQTSVEVFTGFQESTRVKVEFVVDNFGVLLGAPDASAD